MFVSKDRPNINLGPQVMNSTSTQSRLDVEASEGSWYEAYAGATADYYKKYMDKDPTRRTRVGRHAGFQSLLGPWFGHLELVSCLIKQKTSCQYQLH